MEKLQFGKKKKKDLTVHCKLKKIRNKDRNPINCPSKMKEIVGPTHTKIVDVGSGESQN